MTSDFEMVTTVKREFARAHASRRLPSDLVTLVLEFANFENAKRWSKVNRHLLTCRGPRCWGEDYERFTCLSANQAPHKDIYWLQSIDGLDICDCAQHQHFCDCTAQCRNGRNLIRSGVRTDFLGWHLFSQIKRLVNMMNGRHPYHGGLSRAH